MSKTYYKIYKDANGNVGIGTTSPGSTLEIARGSGTSTAKILGTTYSSHFNYSTDEHTYIRGGKATSEVYINDSHSADVLIATGGGSVGIGTAGPGTTKLRVVNGSSGQEIFKADDGATAVIRAKVDGTVSFEKGITLAGRASALNTGSKLQVDNAIALGSSLYTFSQVVGGADLQLISNANPANIGVNSNIIFKLGTSGGGGPVERMRIVSDGKIQIGNNIPMWSGAYGGALILRGDNTTTSRYAQLAIVDSTGSVVNEGMRLSTNGDIGLNCDANNYANKATMSMNGVWGGKIEHLVSGTVKSDWEWSTGGLTVFGTKVSEALQFKTNNTGRVLIDPNGNVKIGSGTANASGKLEIVGNLIINGASNSNVAQQVFTRTDVSWGIFNETNLRIYSSNSNTTSPSTLRFQIASTGAIQFSAYGSGSFTGTSTHYLTVDSSGNVIKELISSGTPTGSGTTNYIPKWNGAVSLTNSDIYEDSGNIGIGTTSPDTWSIGSHFYLTAQAGTNKLAIFNLVADGTNGSYLQLGNASIRRASIHAINGSHLEFSVNNSNSGTTVNPAMRIKNDGNVGIGTISPGYKLEVITPDNSAISVRATSASHGILIGGAAFSTSNAYMGMKTSYMTGVNDYMIISGISDGNTYVSAAANMATHIRGGGNDTNNQIIVRDSSYNTYDAASYHQFSGSVGIGGTPSQKLHVVGKALITDDVQLTGSNPRIDFNSNGASSLRFYDTTNAAERARFNTDGNLGIGTTSPSSTLHVVDGTSGASVLTVDGTNGTLFEVVDDLSGSLMSVNDAAGLPVLEVFADSHIVAGRYGQNDFYLDTNGNLGLGTASPVYKLDLYDATDSASKIGFHNATTGTTAADGTRVGLNGAEFFINNQENSAIKIYTQSTQTNGITILGSGSVGVGTTSPSYPFHVYNTSGTATIAAIIRGTQGYSSMTFGMGQPYLRIGGGEYGGTGYYQGIGFGYGYGGSYQPAEIALETTNTGGYTYGDFVFGVRNVTTNTVPTERMRIKSDGNVGIGTASPSQKLDVSGNIRALGRIDAGLLNSPVAGTTSYTNAVPSSSINITSTGKYVSSSNIRGIVWTGKHYIAQNYSNDSVYFYDSNFNAIENHNGNTFEAVPGNPSNPHGAAWDGRYLWMTEYGTSTSIYLNAYDLTGSSITRVAHCDVNTNVTNATFGIGYAEGLLYIVLNGRVQAYRWEGGDAAVQIFSNPSIYNAGNTTYNSQGIAYDGSYLWTTQNGGYIYKLNLDGDIITTITSNPFTNSCSLAWNGENLVSHNYISTEILIGHTDKRVFLTDKFGIGTTNPQQKLHITGGNVLIEGGSTDSRLIGFTSYDGVTGWSIGNGIIDATHNFRIYDNTAGAARVTVNGSGNVGIGTTGPSYKLHVVGNSYIDATSASQTLLLGRYTGQPTIKAGTDDSGYLIMDSSGAGTGRAALNWYSSDHVVLAQGGGYVGIGNTSPNTHLHVGDGTDNNTWIGVQSTAGQYSGIKLHRGTGNWSSTANNNFGIIVTDNGLAISKFTSPGSNATGRADYLTVQEGGNLGIGTTSPAEKLHLDSGSFRISGNGGIGADGGSTHIPVVGGGGYYTQSSSQTGYLKITLPVSWNESMVQFTVDVYEYFNGGAKSFTFAGYLYSGGSYWYQTSAYMLTDADTAEYTIRFGHDGTKCAVYIDDGGGASGSWSYPQVRVRDVMVGYSGYAVNNWVDGWSVGFTTSLGTISQTQTCGGGGAVNGSGAANKVAYWTDTDTISYNTNFHWDNSNGRLGVGCVPGETLDVNGFVRSRNSGFYAGRADASGQAFGSGAPTILLRGSSSNSSYSGRAGALWFKRYDGTDTAALYSTDGTDSYGLIMAAYQGDIKFSTSTLAGYKMTILSGGNVGINTTSPTEKLEVNGNIKHQGLTMTSGTDIDQLSEFSQTLTITTSWGDTGISSSNLATGTYIVQLFVNDYSVGGGQYSVYYSGTMSWYGSGTNDADFGSEIILHRAGHADNGKYVYLRTLSQASGVLKLQIAGNYSASGSSTYTFKFRRMI